MKQSLQLKLGQHLAMTPQLQQAIRLLQLSTLELQTEVQDALDSNLMLEMDDDSDARSTLNGESVLNGDSPLQENRDLSSDDGVDPVDIPNELATDSAWEDIYDAPVSNSGPGDSGIESAEVFRAEITSLQDHIEEQINLVRLSDTDRVIATAIVDALTEDGYLGTTVHDLHQSLCAQGMDIDEDEVVAVLRQVQCLDPAGVGARDLAECLRLQLAQLSSNVPYRDKAIALVTHYLDVLGARDYAQLMRLLSLDKEQLQDVISLVQTLNPRPGSLIESTPPEYVVPDVYVRKAKGVWQVELNGEAFPRLRVNNHYASLIRRADNSADNNTMKTHLQEARWFIKSLKSRSETLLKVANAIVQRQQGFLDHGEEAMKPMVLADVAEAVEMHESTISRVTTNKYMHTPRGIYELKYFFSSHVFMKSGAECSSTAIRALLKKLIAAENPQKPLSDSKLANILSDQGINVARRTVAKYRESLSIPSSTDRKALG